MTLPAHVSLDDVNRFHEARQAAYCSSMATPKKCTTSPIVTGTSVVAIRYKDGVVMAADTLGSYGSLARFRQVERMRQFGSYTCVGAGGEYSDFQMLSKLLKELITEDLSTDDGSTLGPRQIYTYLTRVLYNRRCRFDPLWNQLIVAGYRDGKSFLGYVDLLGTSYEDDTIATGYGAYIATPLLRKAYKPDLSLDEAKEIVQNCMRVLFYRDARTINRIQMATINTDGISISEPFSLQTDWLAEHVRQGVVGGGW